MKPENTTTPGPFGQWALFLANTRRATPPDEPRRDAPEAGADPDGGDIGAHGRSPTGGVSLCEKKCPDGAGSFVESMRPS